jgi:hypothetical protein
MLAGQKSMAEAMKDQPTNHMNMKPMVDAAREDPMAASKKPKKGAK